MIKLDQAYPVEAARGFYNTSILINSTLITRNRFVMIEFGHVTMNDRAHSMHVFVMSMAIVNCVEFML